jgi:hypothetical protein
MLLRKIKGYDLYETINQIHIGCAYGCTDSEFTVYSALHTNLDFF